VTERVIRGVHCGGAAGEYMLPLINAAQAVKKVGARIGESRGDRFGVLHRKRKSIWRGKIEAGLRLGVAVGRVWRGPSIALLVWAFAISPRIPFSASNPGFFDDRHFGLLMGYEEDVLQKWK